MVPDRQANRKGCFMKKLILVVLLVGFLVGGTGCRLPFIDPPIVGRWKIMEEELTIPGGSTYLVFNRNNTGYLEISFLVISDRSGVFTWSYDREKDILYMDGDDLHDSLQVQYNFLRTKATLIGMNDDHQMTLALRSTPIFRL